ncbi:MAG: ABC transporter substrate-binding protein [Bdellovibrionota bacterium]|nr:MAG: ABC transporter substrate-binding protein [Bdellovibrionota bacterium]
MRGLLSVIILLTFGMSVSSKAAEPVHVGVASVLSGDLQNLGQNIVRTVETYQRHWARHPMRFSYEDSRISSADGLRAYQALINVKKVDVIIGGVSSNGTLAGSALINASRTATLLPVTGGTNVDRAGEYIFRIANSDLLNGVDQAELFKARNMLRVALFTEETEATADTAEPFRKRFAELGGTLVFDETFLPGSTDFRSHAVKILSLKPQAIFVPTQTGLALALFLKQLAEVGSFNGEVHTTFTAALNPDAKTIAGDLMRGLYYMAPKYAADSQRLKDFFARYREDHGQDPDIPFHTAATVDALDLLERYLDTTSRFDRVGFHDFLITKVKSYPGLLATFSLDKDGNSDVGFAPAQMQ